MMMFFVFDAFLLSRPIELLFIYLLLWLTHQTATLLGTTIEEEMLVANDLVGMALESWLWGCGFWFVCFCFVVVVFVFILRLFSFCCFSCSSSSFSSCCCH
jgi:hypothetical protein